MLIMPRGVLKFGFGRGVQLTTQIPYPLLVVILAEIVPGFMDSSPKIRNLRPVYRDFPSNLTFLARFYGFHAGIVEN